MKLFFQFIGNRKYLIFLTFLFVLFNFLLSQFMPKDYALDLMFAYTSAEAYEALSHLDMDQLNRYRLGLLCLDMPYLLVYGLLFSGILMKLWKNKKLVFLPFTIVLMDFFENLMVLGILTLYPVENDMLATFASVFSTSKWVLVGLLFLTIICGIVFLLVARFTAKPNSGKAGV